jgi:hypothetical protein
MQVTERKMSIGETNQALHSLFAAYFHTVPLSELIESMERARRVAQLRYVSKGQIGGCALPPQMRTSKFWIFISTAIKPKSSYFTCPMMRI